MKSAWNSLKNDSKFIKNSAETFFSAAVLEYSESLENQQQLYYVSMSAKQTEMD